ncbi:MAG TPA: NAD-dependent epimerase/dehydratase family protein [Phenylobacterium sp.]|uniref:NAD-dependent epimerase/dehydratase family protein n=1 Tax=Phenylobacterium sp. TaxID=1871053 RepID=UPI002C12ED78|nr:NAD-dependent epimerase/dehydratase family protein [Phenylobacterium sp.]HSV01659.1 NAD-dependent epimerase/dehydratase family protein [Phenylobacterium sp.]
MTTQPLALVIGATGGFGGETAQALIDAGWRVRGLNRDPERARTAAGGLAVEWVKGDAMVRDDVRAAAEGARVIVHAANPPGYRNWKGLALPMLEATIAAAAAEGARIVFPGNVYNYGPDAFPTLSEASPQHPLARKGAIRVAMERRLAEAAQDGAKSIILRAGDFFGPRASTSWLGRVVFQAGKPVRSLTYPGPLGVPHAHAYLPDLARTAVRLIEKEAELSAHASFHFAGHALSGHELAAAFEAVVGRKLPVRAFPWIALYAAGPFNETFRELSEMRYLWRETVLLDNARLIETLGGEPHTPIEQALAETLSALGCLERPELARAA